MNANRTVLVDVMSARVEPKPPCKAPSLGGIVGTIGVNLTKVGVIRVDEVVFRAT